MKSERRTAYEELELKIEVFEDILEHLNERVCDFGERLYDVPKEELESMRWGEMMDHQQRTSEGLVCSRLPYPDDEDEEWKKLMNKKYYHYAKAFEIVRTALEKWLDK